MFVCLRERERESVSMCAGVYLRERTTCVWSYDRVFCSVDLTLVIKPAVKPSLETSYQALPSETTGLERLKALRERAHHLLFWSRKKVKIKVLHALPVGS